MAVTGAPLVAPPVHCVVRLARLLPHNNIILGFSDDLEQFFLFRGRNFELVQGFLEFRSHYLPLFLANIVGARGASFIDFPVYLHGPPLTSQTS